MVSLSLFVSIVNCSLYAYFCVFPNVNIDAPHQSCNREDPIEPLQRGDFEKPQTICNHKKYLALGNPKDPHQIGEPLECGPTFVIQDPSKSGQCCELEAIFQDLRESLLTWDEHSHFLGKPEWLVSIGDHQKIFPIGDP